MSHLPLVAKCPLNEYSYRWETHKQMKLSYKQPLEMISDDEVMKIIKVIDKAINWLFTYEGKGIK